VLFKYDKVVSVFLRVRLKRAFLLYLDMLRCF